MHHSPDNNRNFRGLGELNNEHARALNPPNAKPDLGNLSPKLRHLPQEALQAPKSEQVNGNTDPRVTPWQWIKEAYTRRGITVLNGVVSSCFSLATTYFVSQAAIELGLARSLVGLAAMGVSMIVWDVSYSAQLYYFYDRKLMRGLDGKVPRKEFWQQIKRYTKNVLQADVGWAISYQSLYALCAYIFNAPPTQAAAWGHLMSIVYVDLLRPILLKANRTLKMDQ